MNSCSRKEICGIKMLFRWFPIFTQSNKIGFCYKEKKTNYTRIFVAFNMIMILFISVVVLIIHFHFFFSSFNFIRNAPLSLFKSLLVKLFGIISVVSLVVIFKRISSYPFSNCVLLFSMIRTGSIPKIK